MMLVMRAREFANGRVVCSRLDDGALIETTDTFLPLYTKDAIGRKQNMLATKDLGSRKERWMVGVSCMSGCPVRCKFCATSQMPSWRRLTKDEIVDQVHYVVEEAKLSPRYSSEFKINYTRMGEPFFNLENVRAAIREIENVYAGANLHHYVSTVGIRGSDFSWVKDNITLQISLHTSTDERRRDLMPRLESSLMTIEELGQIRTGSSLKTTLNMTLVGEDDFDIEVLKRNFDPKHFFIKLSPINPNEVSDRNGLGRGVIQGVNLL